MGERAEVRASGREGCRPIAVMKVEIKNCGGFQFALALQRVCRNDQPVKRAEAFAVISVAMMKSARQRRGHTVTSRLPRGRQTRAVGQAHRWKQLRTPGKFLRFSERVRYDGGQRRD